MKKTILAWAMLACVLLAGCTGIPKEEHEQALARNAELTAEVQQLEESIAAREAELAGMQASMDEMDERLGTLTGENKALQQQVDSADAALADMAARNAALEKQLATAQANAGTSPGAGAAASRDAGEAGGTQAPQATGVGIWVPNTGSKYHSTSTCSNMKNPSQTTEEDAISRGFGRCSKCW